jgi:hypothetical protein
MTHANQGRAAAEQAAADQTELLGDSRRDHDGRYAPPNPGAAAPEQILNRAAAVLAKLADERAEQIAKAVMTAAENGNLQAAKLVYSRRWAAPRDRRMSFPIAPLKSAADLPKITADLVRLVSQGVFSPAEGQALAAMVGDHRRTLEAVELEAKIVAIEQANKERDSWE